MATSASFESLHHNGVIEERDRKGWGDYSTCYYESVDEEDQQ